MSSTIPYTHWHPLSLAEVVRLFADAPFPWGIAGGYAIEQFLGTSIRDHADIDVLVYRDTQLQLQRWLPEWQLFAADPPGTLRTWIDNEYLPYGIHDIWGHRVQAQTWELQVMLAEVEQNQWFMRKHPEIRGQRDDLLVPYRGIPCVRVEVQLLYKSRGLRPKDTCDFRACLPWLSADARQWLRYQLQRLFPAGHAWLEDLQ